MDERTSGTSLGHEDGEEGSGEGGGGGGGGGVEKGDGDRGGTVRGVDDCSSVVELGVKSEEQGVAGGGGGGGGGGGEKTVAMEEKGKPVESRSLYHSIQQLSLPSSRSSGCFQELVANKAPKLYKLADFVSQPDNCRSTEEDEEEDDDEEEKDGMERVSRIPLPRDQRGSDGWKGFDGKKNTEEEFSEDDDEEFFRTSVRDVTDMSDDLSDVEMMSYDGSTSQADDVGQFDCDPVPDRRSAAGSSSSDAGREEVRLEAKRARVESIIKTMTPVIDSASVVVVRQQFANCRDFPPTAATATAAAAAKKRKQYIPQQVDPRGGGGVNGPPATKICARERSAVRSGMQRLEEELAEMQTKYQELLDRDGEVSSFQMSDEDEDAVGGQGRMGSERSFISVSDVNQNDVKNTNKELLRRKYVRASDVIADADSVRLNVAASSVLEHLANVLKVEITREVGRLVDSYLGPFVVGDFRPSGPVQREAETAKRRAAPQRKDSDHVGSSDDVTVNGSERRGAKSDSDPDDRIKEENDRRRSAVIKDDLLEVVSPEVDDEPPLPVHEKRHPPTTTPLLLPPPPQMMSGSNCHPSASDRRLTPLPHHCLPMQFFRGSDGVGRALDHRESSGVPDKCYFDGGGGGGGLQGTTTPRDVFGGLTQPAHLQPLFAAGSHHHSAAAAAAPGGLYYSPCVAGGKFPQAFLKDQDQLEPLPLIVGQAPKKAKRTKVIDRVSPRAVKSIPHEVQAQPEDETAAQPRSDSPHNAPIFHPSSRYHPTGAGPVHDAFSPHPSLLPFGLAHHPAVGLQNPGLQQHSKFIQAMYSQMSSIGGHRGEHGPTSSLLSPSHRSSLCSAQRDPGVPGSKSIQKPIDFGAMTCSDSMMALPGHGFTSTLTPMHLRKAKLMFFYVRYPSSSILKVYFPDVKFNKNNTAQLVKWFSNFREFYYIQMEKYARQALAEGAKGPKDLIVSSDSELYRILIIHYNRNCQIEIPENFRFVAQATLREFFTSIAAEKDQEPSWKKSIYKVIQRMDDPVPEYFKSPNWMERLVDG